MAFLTGYYDYEELKEKALKSDATQKDIDALANWFENWGMDFWNGEYFEIDSDHRLFPVYEEVEVEEDDFEFRGYELR